MYFENNSSVFFNPIWKIWTILEFPVLLLIFEEMLQISSSFTIVKLTDVSKGSKVACVIKQTSITELNRWIGYTHRK